MTYPPHPGPVGPPRHGPAPSAGQPPYQPQPGAPLSGQQPGYGQPPGVEQQSGQPYGFPPGSATPAPPPPRPHRSYTGLIIAALVVVVVVVVTTGLAVVGYHYVVNSSGGELPDGSGPTAPGEPIYRKFPAPCGMLAKPTLAATVPAGESMLDSNRPGPSETDGAHAVCHFIMPYAESERRAMDRSLRVTLDAHLHERYATGVDRAKKVFADSRATLQGLADKGEDEGQGTRTVFGKLEEPGGLGDEAVAMYTTTTSDDRRYGGTDLRVRVGNVYLQVSYTGFDGREGQERPMTPEVARQGAQDAARDVVEALIDCPDCKS
ncbi:hypothetical protein ACFP2T_29770 [Plantactinospora solaniradicis]|uniref:DUF3558 domain-containing protein n=1 Tax=Plantactinospora solaniradicis TaxID=1723736 RepID=A0ABW1KF61_9ACTN